MSIVSELVTKIKADENDFVRGMTKALSSADSFSSGASKRMATVGKSVVAMAAIVATVAVAAFGTLLNTIMDAADGIDDLNDAANKLSIDVGGLQKLNYAAKLSGSSAQELERSLARLIKTTSAAERGQGSAVAALKLLGLTFRDLKALNPEQQFLLVSDQIKKLNDPLKQADAAIQIFGRQGQNILQLMRGDVRGLGQEFEKMGGVITNQQADMVANFKDSQDKIAAMWDTFKVQLTVAVVPALQLVSDWVTKNVEAMGGMGPAAKTAASFIVSGILLGVQALQSMLTFIDRIALGIDKIALKWAEINDNLDYQTITFGGEADFENMRKLAKLKKDVAEGEKNIAAGGSTANLQRGLVNVRNSLNTTSSENRKQETDVKISLKVDKQGVIQTVVESDGFKGTVTDLLESKMAREARSVAR